MKKEAKVKAPEPMDGFFITVDGVKSGPFREKYRKQYSSLIGKKGVEFTHVRLLAGFIEPPKPSPARKKDKTMPLLDGLAFTPVPKHSRH